MATLPPGWRHGRLGDVVASITAGVSIEGEDRPCGDGEAGVLKITSVLTGIFEPKHHKTVSPADQHRVGEPVMAGTVLVSRANGNVALVGMSAHVPVAMPSLFLPDLLWAVRATRNVNPEWLSYLINSPSFRPRLLEIAVGSSTLKKITQEGFQSLPIAIPPSIEQDAIVNVLRTWDEGITVADQTVAAALQAEHNLVARMFSLEAHEGWSRTALGRVATINPGTDIIGAGNPVAFYGMADLSDAGAFRILPAMREFSAVRSGFTRFLRGDVLVAKITPCFENGKAGWLREAPTRVCFGSTEFHVIRPNAGIPGEIIAAIVRHPSFRSAGKAAMSGSAGQQRIPADFLSSFPLSWPSTETMDVLESRLACAAARRGTLQAVADQLRVQKRTLMSRLLSGSLRIPPSLLPAEAVPEMADA